MTGPPLDPADAQLGFVEILGELQDLMGKEVDVVVSEDADGPALVARLTGTLQGTTGVTVNPDRAEQEAQFFIVGADDPLSGFLLHAGTFRGGERYGSTVRFFPGAVLVAVSPLERGAA